MAKRTITSTRHIQQVVRDAAKSDIDSSVRMAIQNLQNQLNALYNTITETFRNKNEDMGPDGSFGSAQREFSELTNLFNNSGVGRNLGDVVVADSSLSSSFTTTGTANDEGVIGVVAVESQDGTAAGIEAGKAGVVCTGGVCEVKVNADAGAIEAGTFLKAHSISGYAAGAAHPGEVGIFATALKGISEGTGIVKAIIHPRHAYENFPIGQEKTTVFHWNSGGELTGADVFRTQAMSAYIARHSFAYVSGILVSAVTSAYDSDGETYRNTVRRILSYASDRLDRIIKEIS